MTVSIRTVTYYDYRYSHIYILRWKGGAVLDLLCAILRIVSAIPPTLTSFVYLYSHDDECEINAFLILFFVKEEKHTNI